MHGQHNSDSDAFNEALAPHDDALKRYCEFLCKKTQGRLANDSEDIWQTAKINAYQAYGRFKPGTDFLSWLFRIAHNTFIDATRREKRDKSHSGPPDDNETPLEDRLSHPDLDPASLYLRKERRHEIWAALEKLSPRHQMLIKLCVLDGLTYQECAERLGFAVDSIGTTLTRAKRQLRDLLGPQRYDEMGIEREQRG